MDHHTYTDPPSDYAVHMVGLREGGGASVYTFSHFGEKKDAFLKKRKLII